MSYSYNSKPFLDPALSLLLPRRRQCRVLIATYTPCLVLLTHTTWYANDIGDVSECRPDGLAGLYLSTPDIHQETRISVPYTTDSPFALISFLRPFYPSIYSLYNSATSRLLTPPASIQIQPSGCLT